MIYQDVFYIIMLATFVIYVISIRILYGMLPSISESYYYLPKKNKYLFTFFTWIVGISAIIIGQSFLMFIAGAGIAWVGASASFKDKLTKTVHFSGAGIGILASQLAIYFQYDMKILVGIYIICCILAIFIVRRSYIWWIEIGAFTSICIALGISLYF